MHCQMDDDEDEWLMKMFSDFAVRSHVFALVELLGALHEMKANPWVLSIHTVTKK